jgi:hypothetical protein
MTSTFLVGVTGESQVNNDGTSRQELIKRLRAGDQVKLIPDPTNPHDRWAVRVLTDDGQQIGWLPSDARDAGPLLKGEPVTATVHAIRGGTEDKPFFGVVLEITKGDPDWTRFNELTRVARPFDARVKAALELKDAADPESMVAAFRHIIADIRTFTQSNPQASAHRCFEVPVDELTHALERQKKFSEALEVIEDWKTAYDPVQPNKSIAAKIRKRADRLELKLKKQKAP